MYRAFPEISIFNVFGDFCSVLIFCYKVDGYSQTFNETCNCRQVGAAHAKLDFKTQVYFKN